MTQVETTVEQRGPFFRPGLVDAELNQAYETGLHDAGRNAVSWAHSDLDVKLKAPTGYYRSQVTYQLRQQTMDVRVDDGGVAYGPWLERGRSRRKTRFRGYHMFRRNRNRINKHAPKIIEAAVERAVRRVNGA